jgi:hypothetical protein
MTGGLGLVLLKVKFLVFNLFPNDSNFRPISYVTGKIDRARLSIGQHVTMSIHFQLVEKLEFVWFTSQLCH